MRSRCIASSRVIASRLTTKLSDRAAKPVTRPFENRVPKNGPAQPGSLQRLVRQPNVHHSEISNPSLFPKTQWRPAMSLRRECSHETREIHEKKSAFIHALLPNLRIQQEVTEKTEDRVRPRSLRCLLFKPLGVARRRTVILGQSCFAMTRSK